MTGSRRLAADDPVSRYHGALLASGLGRFADALVEAVRPSIRLDSEIASDEVLPLGASKLGGRPDLSAGSSWPAAHGIPLAFVAQLQLDELTALDRERVLPSAGLLSFFFEATWALAGNSPNASWDVLFTPASTSLERIEFPAELDPYARYETAALQGRREPTFVPWESQLLAELGLARADVSAYFDVLDRAGVLIRRETHRLLGYPDQLNGDVQLQCPYVARGLRVRDPEYDERLHRAFAREARQWRLLLQVDSFDEIGMDFFMGSLVFFSIRDDDLAARRFHRAAVTTQR